VSGKPKMAMNERTSKRIFSDEKDDFCPLKTVNYAIISLNLSFFHRLTINQ